MAEPEPVTDFDDDDLGDPPAPGGVPGDLPDDEVEAIRQAERDADPSVRSRQVS